MQAAEVSTASGLISDPVQSTSSVSGSSSPISSSWLGALILTTAAIQQ